MHTELFWGKPKIKWILWRPRRGWKIILNWILKNTGYTAFIWFRTETSRGSCKHYGNEHSGSMKDGKCLTVSFSKRTLLRGFNAPYIKQTGWNVKNKIPGIDFFGLHATFISRCGTGTTSLGKILKMAFLPTI
jgi:hypothetical protein